MARDLLGFHISRKLQAAKIDQVCRRQLFVVRHVLDLPDIDNSIDTSGAWRSIPLHFAPGQALVGTNRQCGEGQRRSQGKSHDQTVLQDATMIPTPAVAEGEGQRR